MVRLNGFISEIGSLSDALLRRFIKYSSVRNHQRAKYQDVNNPINLHINTFCERNESGVIKWAYSISTLDLLNNNCFLASFSGQNSNNPLFKLN